jgi:hypothetical protein
VSVRVQLGAEELVKAVWRRRIGLRSVWGERQFVVGLIAASLALTAGCSSAAKPTSGVTLTASPSATASLAPSAAAEREALAAYVGMWQAHARAAQVPDPDYSELRQFAADRALARLVSVLVAYRESGVVTTGEPIVNARITGASPAEAPIEVAVADCGDSTNWRKHKKATGEPIPDDVPGRHNITAVVKPVDGSWKVVSFDVGDLGSC